MAGSEYWSFFRTPSQIETTEKVPAFVDTFYNLVTDIYEWGWGQSFHFSPSLPGKSHRNATRLAKKSSPEVESSSWVRGRRAGEKSLQP
ncbi:unnamed protein product [Linum trigynum]|uniref:Uncharacterized protein n=1 Tax=Linum trigynum TaxID=586398 RepID=A0AAV2CCS0_9ROSI